MNIRPNVSGGAGGERWDRRHTVKCMARGARRGQDTHMIAEGLADMADDNIHNLDWPTTFRLGSH